MSVITASRPGACKRCHRIIPAGEKVNWSKGMGITHLEECEIAPAPEPSPDEGRAVAQLELLEGQGKLNNFTRSLYEQWKSKGYLSPRQVQAIVSKLEAPKSDPAYGPDAIPAGRYAIVIDGKDVVLRVWRGTQNPNVVRVYDYDTGEKVSDKAGMLRWIFDVGAATAALRFGKLRSRCSRCDARLETRLSIRLAVGPVCGKYWYDHETWKKVKALAREIIRREGHDPNENIVSKGAGVDVEQLQLETA